MDYGTGVFIDCLFNGGPLDGTTRAVEARTPQGAPPGSVNLARADGIHEYAAQALLDGSGYVYVYTGRRDNPGGPVPKPGEQGA